MKRLSFLFILLSLFSSWGFADPHVLPQSVGQTLLSESLQRFFLADDPVDLSVQDYRLKWAKGPISGVQFRFAQNSLEWVRVEKILVLPRARILVSIENADSAVLFHQGFSYSFKKQGSSLKGEFPVAMISGKRNPIRIRVKRGNKLYEGEVSIAFSPRPSNQGKVVFDTSCSPFGLEKRKGALPPKSWAYVGCRMARVEGEEYRTGALELYLFWDGVGEKVQIDQISIPSRKDSIWPLRIAHEPGVVEFSTPDSEWSLSYFVPKRVHNFFVGAGLGPYSYTYLGGGDDFNSITVIPTLYVSYFFSEKVKIVAFDATAIHRQFFTDFGLYLKMRQLDLFDNRLSIDFLLGGHVLVFRAAGNTHFNFGGPQGVEVLYRDFLATNHQLGVGGFVFPNIGGEAYYNLWVRWGSRIFAEINYIAWRESFSSGQDFVYTRSVGLTVGFPLFRLF